MAIDVFFSLNKAFLRNMLPDNPRPTTMTLVHLEKYRSQPDFQVRLPMRGIGGIRSVRPFLLILL
jgi:hypothetical protein